MNRRLFLQAAGAASLVGQSAVAEAASVAAQAAIALVYDARIDQSRRFAEAFSRSGAVILAVGMEGLEPWREAQRREWRRMVGLTTHSDFLIWSEAARRAGLRLRWETLHHGRGEPGDYPGTLVSWMFG